MRIGADGERGGDPQLSSRRTTNDDTLATKPQTEQPCLLMSRARLFLYPSICPCATWVMVDFVPILSGTSITVVI